MMVDTTELLIYAIDYDLDLDSILGEARMQKIVC